MKYLSSVTELAPVCAIILLGSGCFSSSEITATLATPTPTTSSTTSTVVSSGLKAVKIIFRNTSIIGNGSFTVPTAAGASAAATFFDVDGSTIVSKPSWLSSVELGITAITGNTCSKFTEATETGTVNCELAAAFTNVDDSICAGPESYFRVSEADCDGTSDGTGGLLDSVYVRFKVDRTTSILGTSENLLAVYEYSAGSTAPHINSACFSSGFTPEACSPFTWKLYGKSDSASTAFMTMIPPVFSPLSTSAAGAATAGSANSSDMITTKQVIIPLSGMTSGVDTFILSRIKRGSAYSNTRCSSNSPLCNGVILYSLTLYRI